MNKNFFRSLPRNPKPVEKNHQRCSNTLEVHVWRRRIKDSPFSLLSSNRTVHLLAGDSISRGSFSVVEAFLTSESTMSNTRYAACRLISTLSSALVRTIPVELQGPSLEPPAPRCVGMQPAGSDQGLSRPQANGSRLASSFRVARAVGILRFSEKSSRFAAFLLPPKESTRTRASRSLREPPAHPGYRAGFIVPGSFGRSAILRRTLRETRTVFPAGSPREKQRGEKKCCIAIVHTWSEGFSLIAFRL